ncbi:MAG: hypothetical protein AAF720_09135 [Pseudomonadota bacterium]
MADNFYLVDRNTLQAGDLSDPNGTKDAAVRGRIMRFMRQMHSETGEDALVQAAIDRSWLDTSGRPTPEGQRLVRAFNDLERFS